MILQGNALQIPLASNAVHCCVTSPPYWGLRDYGVDGQLGLEPTPEEYVSHMVDVFREVWRVLRDDGTLWLNLGDSYVSQPAGNKMPNQFMAQVHQSARENEDDPRRATSGRRVVIPDGLKQKDLVGIPWRVAFALQADGWYLRSDIIWSKPNPMPESVTDRPTKSHEYLFLLAKSERYFYDSDAVKEEATAEPKKCGPKNDSSRNDGDRTGIVRGDGTSRNRRTVWNIATAPYSGAHFATYPPALVEPCIKAGCPKDGIVFDPFNGSGTTGLVAQKLGRRYVGLDLSFDYLMLARERLGMKALDEWENGIQAGNDGWHDLPLFQ